MTQYTYRPLVLDADLEALTPIMVDAFGGPSDGTQKWLTEAAPHVRVVEEDGHVRGGLALYPMAHWFGGRSVPARGVAGVATDAAHRGRGVGTAIMRGAVREMHDEGTALSSLFPALLPLYRRTGYERAGDTWLVRCRLAELGPTDRSLPLRRGTPDDEPTLEELERQRGGLHDGNVDRTPFMWRRSREVDGVPRDVYLVEEDGAITGYVRLRHTRPKGERELALRDLVVTTPGAANRLLAFLADHASQVQHACWLGRPGDALQMAATARCFELKAGDEWMLRLTHVETALTARGYAPGLSAEIHLELKDDLCPGNAGRWVLRLEDGAPAVERGGHGRLRMHVRDLAPIYSGHQHPLALRCTNRIEGGEADLRALGAVFAGGAPWMQETF